MATETLGAEGVAAEVCAAAAADGLQALEAGVAAGSDVPTDAPAGAGGLTAGAVCVPAPGGGAAGQAAASGLAVGSCAGALAATGEAAPADAGVAATGELVDKSAAGGPVVVDWTSPPAAAVDAAVGPCPGAPTGQAAVAALSVTEVALESPAGTPAAAAVRRRCWAWRWAAKIG
ncbi:MAG: hypothetical protein LC713_02395 [Actinobacteria bacterium]|nr:hypothetical protein [Actinomycetota bacterium]